MRELQSMFNSHNSKPNELQVVKSDKFGDIICDVYSNNSDEYFMTIDQLSHVLGYASKDGVEKIIARNEYLRDGEFSTTYRLGVVEGDREVSRDRILFSEDGIYEITMLSQTEKAESSGNGLGLLLSPSAKQANMKPQTFFPRCTIPWARFALLGGVLLHRSESSMLMTI